MNVSSQQRTDERGSVMLYTILALAVIVNVIIIVSNVVVMEVKQSANTDQATRAYYLAEGGVEKTLYRYRKMHDLVASADCGPPIPSCAISMLNGYNPFLPFKLAANQSVEYSLAQPNTAGLWVDQVESVQITWDNPTVWLEFSYVEWDPVAAAWSDEGVNKVLLQGGSGVVNALTQGKRYKIRIKSIDGLTSGTLALYNGNNATGQLVAASDILYFEATGSYGNATQRVRATMPPQPTVGGLFDYVLFTEKAITK